MAIIETLAHLTTTKTLTTPKTFASASSSPRLMASWRIACNPRAPPPLPQAGIDTSAAADRRRRFLSSFDPTIPLQEAVTPPASWYTDPSFLALEFDRVFFRGWQAVGKSKSLLFYCYFAFTLQSNRLLNVFCFQASLSKSRIAMIISPEGSFFFNHDVISCLVICS